MISSMSFSEKGGETLNVYYHKGDDHIDIDISTDVVCILKIDDIIALKNYLETCEKVISEI